MNKLRNIFMKGLISGRDNISYRDAAHIFNCLYTFEDIDINDMRYRYSETGNNEYYSESYTYELTYKKDTILFLISFFKYDSDKIKILFKDLILARKRFLEIKETVENNLGELKLGIKI